MQIWLEYILQINCSLLDANMRRANAKCKNSFHTRCNLKISNLLSKCNRHGATFAAEYTMICKKWDLVEVRHNCTRDKLALLISLTAHSSDTKIKLKQKNEID